jgi:hypothetical protein
MRTRLAWKAEDDDMENPKIPKIPVTAAQGRTIAAAVPVVLVNAVAFAGQLAFLREHLPWPLAGQVMVALALESVAIYLAWHAHLAQLANDSALRLRLAAYGFALVIATANYSHYAAADWRPTFAAVAVALCSAISPWLWGVHSRRASRDRLIAAGLIEPHALRLGVTRWAWHPYRSACVMWKATWEGITDPSEALAKYRDAPSAKPSASRTSPSEVPAASLPQKQASARPQKPARKAAARPTDAERATQIRALLEDGQKVTIDDAMTLLSAGRPVAKRILAIAQNGHGPQDGEMAAAGLNGKAH